MHPLVPSASQLLGLPEPTSSNNSELTDTVISELLPEKPPDQRRDASLQTLGCTTTQETPAAKFLLTTLLAHRIHQQKSTEQQYRKQDQQFADALSRLTLTLRLNPPSITKETLPSYIASLTTHLPSPETPISPDLNPQQLSVLQGIQSRLHQEHLTRIELLLTRLNVTVSAFSRSKLASSHSFSYEQHIQAMRRNAQAVSLYQAISAPRHVLKEPQHVAPTDNVKSFLMGSVPDRGGRLKAPHMPEFRDRIPSGVELKGGNQRGKKGKGKGKGKSKRY